MSPPAFDTLNRLEIPFFGAARAHEDLIGEMESACRSVLLSGQSLQGPAVARFEERLCDMTGRRQAVAVGSATDGLFFALRILGIMPGDEVLVPALSFAASASCILRAGARPVFVDVDNDGHIDLGQAARLLSPRTRAILAVHLYGGMIDPDRLEGFARAHDLLLIEDAAQAFGANFDGRPAGSIGDASVFSFDPTKVVGAPSAGGAVLVDRTDFAEGLRLLRCHGKSADGFVELGYNSQMASLTAAILHSKLDRHPDWLKRRKAIAGRYDAMLRPYPVVLPARPDYLAHGFHKYTLLSDQRDALERHLASWCVPTRRHYSTILPEEPLFARYASGGYPQAAAIARRTVSLPIHAYLAEPEIDHIGQAFASFFG